MCEGLHIQPRPMGARLWFALAPIPTNWKGVIKMSNNCGTLREYDRFVSAIFGGKCAYDFTDKDVNINYHILYMLNRTQSMFKWEGLPDTIPQRDLEILLQCRGYAGFCEVPNKGIYALYGGLGGEQNAYYMPTILTVSNPYLKYTANLAIDEDCIVMPNDSFYLGLLPLMRRYAAHMVETELSINIGVINSRIFTLISSDNDNTTKSAEKYLDDIVKGKLGVIADKPFFDGIKAQPFGTTSNTNVLTNLIEMLQYLKASWYNELGLNANYNMKRESINSGESQLNNDALLPLIDDMLNTRRLAADKINKRFGLSLKVDFASSWEDNEIELENEQKEMKGGEGNVELSDDGETN